MRCCCRGGTVDTLLNVLQLFWTRKREKKGIASFSTHSTRWQDHLAAVHLTPNMRKKPPHHTLISSVLVSFVFGVNGGTSQVQCPVPYNNKARKHHLKIVRWINAIRNAHGTYLVSFKEPCTHTHAHTIFFSPPTHHRLPADNYDRKAADGVSSWVRDFVRHTNSGVVDKKWHEALHKEAMFLVGWLQAAEQQ